MDASGGNNHPVHWISQRATQRPNFLGDVGGEGNNSAGGICVQLIEQVIQACSDQLASLSQQYDFEQADSADSDALSAPDGFIEDAALLPR